MQLSKRSSAGVSGFQLKEGCVGMKKKNRGGNDGDENMKAQQARQMYPFVEMAVGNVGVGTSFEAVGETGCLAAVIQESDSPCQLSSPNELKIVGSQGNQKYTWTRIWDGRVSSSYQC